MRALSIRQPRNEPCEVTVLKWNYGYWLVRATWLRWLCSVGAVTSPAVPRIPKHILCMRGQSPLSYNCLRCRSRRWWEKDGIEKW